MYAEFAERLMDVAHQGQSRLAELRAAAEGTIELQQQLLLQVEQVSSSADPSGGGDPAELSTLREEVEWLGDKLKFAHEELAELKAQSSGIDESELVTELEQARRDIKRLEEELQEAHEAQESQEADDVPSYLASFVASEDDAVQEQLDKAQAEVEERDSQIAELQSQLEELQSQDGAQAQPDIFANDSEIAAERENLRKLQEEWHEKLRKAELEISIERARMARERTELEERVATMESELQTLQGVSPKDTVRGKWFARLGLRDDD